jgi:hypothetical protein
MGTATGLEIYINAKGSEIVVEANSFKSEVDKEPELASVKKWNEARMTELLILGQLNAGMQDYRGSSSLYALLFVIDQKTPGLNDEQLFNEIKNLCISINDLAEQLPNLGDKIYGVVLKEDSSEIKEATQAMAEVSTTIVPLVTTVVGTVVLGAKLMYNYCKNIDSIKRSWNALESDPIPENMESRWIKTMKTIDKVQAGIGGFVGIFGASIQIWQAVKTAEQKDKALATIADNRDAVKAFYDSVMSHIPD